MGGTATNVLHGAHHAYMHAMPPQLAQFGARVEACFRLYLPSHAVLCCSPCSGVRGECGCATSRVRAAAAASTAVAAAVAPPAAAVAVAAVVLLENAVCSVTDSIQTSLAQSNAFGSWPPPCMKLDTLSLLSSSSSSTFEGVAPVRMHVCARAPSSGLILTLQLVCTTHTWPQHDVNKHEQQSAAG